MSLEREIESLLGATLRSSSPLGVGFGLEGISAELDDGRRVAVKARCASSSTSLEPEGFMLRELNDKTNLPVPEVYHCTPDLLIMSWIKNDGGSISPSVERHAAELLAELHGVPRTKCGYSRDTLIGPLHQPNPECENWITFFRDHRLLHMAGKAHEEGALSAAHFKRLERFAKCLDDLLTEPAHPSLIHGDLWTGNVLVNGDRIGGFVDPAIYHAHAEIELAFTTMFSTFGRAFFEAYENLRPLEPGFHDTRREIYNLYPLLVHVRLFGLSYLGGIDRVLRRHGI